MSTETLAKPATPRQLLNKVPEVTIWFWLIKVLCTTVGESLADYINTNLGFGLGGTAVVFTVVLAAVLAAQLRAHRYVPALYWLVVVLVSVTGTLYTDLLTDQLGVPLAVSSAIFTVLLIAVFGTWYYRERTLSIHSITTHPREGFYWVTVLVTFALGTATGDWVLDLTGWTPGQSVLLPVVLIGIVAAGWRAGANPVLAFWLAYVLTRPLGANLGDYLGRSKAEGGVGLGVFATSMIFLAAIAGIVAFLTRTRVDVTTSATEQPYAATAGRERLVLGGWAVAAVVAAGVVGVAASHHTGGAALSDGPSPSASLPAGQQAQPLTAADLAQTTAATRDILSSVQRGQQKEATARARDLETVWDDAASSLQAKDPQRWSVLDSDVDAVLTSVRAKKPDAAAETASLQALLTALNG